MAAATAVRTLQIYNISYILYRKFTFTKQGSFVMHFPDDT